MTEHRHPNGVLEIRHPWGSTYTSERIAEPPPDSTSVRKARRSLVALLKAWRDDASRRPD